MTLKEAWLRNHHITLNFVKAIPAAAFTAQYSPRTRSVAAQFAHIHYVRVANLEERGREYLGDLEKFPKGYEPKKRELQTALKKSGLALAKLMEKFEQEDKVKSWSGAPPATWLGYHIAHESHHRALAIVCCRFAGHKLDSAATYGLWSQWRKPGSP